MTTEAVTGAATTPADPARPARPAGHPALEALSETRRRIAALYEAMPSHDTVATATGIVMARLELGADDARTLIATAGRRSGRGLVAVAEEVVATRQPPAAVDAPAPALAAAPAPVGPGPSPAPSPGPVSRGAGSAGAAARRPRPLPA